MELHQRNNILQQNVAELFNKTVMSNRKMELIKQNEFTLNKMIQQEKIERENVTKQMTFEIANQNTNLSCLHKESTRLNRRVKLLQQNFTTVKKGIEAELLQREKSLHNVTNHLRQNIAGQNVATIKKLLLITSNVAELFKEICNNRKLIMDDSHNFTKQVNVLRQKQMELDHMNNILQ